MVLDSPKINRRKILYFLLVLSLCGVYSNNVKPNIVIFLADDMGYGDAQCFGSPLASTPNIDKLQSEGLKLTQMYSTSPICSPARAGLLTGRYPVRSGVWNNEEPIVFTASTTVGLPLNETIIPEMLAYQGYKSAIVGKWHLGTGVDKEYLPLNQGFDHYFGTPNSHEGCSCVSCFYPDVPCEGVAIPGNDTFPCPLMFENELIEQPLNLTTLAVRQTQAARTWIREFACDKTPFFLYYASLHPHAPHFANDQHRNSTLGGEYTDSLAEMDWELGEVMDELRKNNLIDNTLIFFSSDNGPDQGLHVAGGFSGPLRCGKYSTFDGGSRVPSIVYWPGKIKPGVSRELLSHLDIWPTLRRLSGSHQDDFDVVIDGYDITDVLFNGKESPRNALMYYNLTPDPDIGAYAVRNKEYKAHFFTENNLYLDFDHIDPMCRGGNKSTEHSIPILYNILLDPEEKFNIANVSLDVCQQMTELMTEEATKVDFAQTVLASMNTSIRMCCDEGCSPFPGCCDCPSLYTDDLLVYADCEPTRSKRCKKVRTQNVNF